MRNNNFEDIILNRRSIKVFDENVKIDRDEMLEILNKTVQAPSSLNMQPWRFVVIDTPEGKNLLKPIVKYNTRQNETSSAMIVLFGDMRCHEKAEDILNKMVEEGLMPEDKKEKFLSSYVPMYENFSRQDMNDIVKVDSSLAAMQLMLIARAYGYETNAIGGFDKANIAETLGLDPERYVPVMIIAIGKPNYNAHGSVRLDAKEITTFM